MKGYRYILDLRKYSIVEGLERLNIKGDWMLDGLIQDFALGIGIMDELYDWADAARCWVKR